MLLTGTAYHAQSSDGDHFSNECNMGSVGFFLHVSLRDNRVNFLERLIFRLLGQSNIIPLMIKSNNITAQLREEALEKIERILSIMDDIVLKRRTTHHSQSSSNHDDLLFDIGASTQLLSAADITFASLCMPLLLPPEGMPMFTVEDMETWLRNQDTNSSGNSNNSTVVGLQRLLQTRQRLLDAHPSARLALKLYKHQRFSVSHNKSTSN